MSILSKDFEESSTHIVWHTVKPLIESWMRLNGTPINKELSFAGYVVNDYDSCDIKYNDYESLILPVYANFEDFKNGRDADYKRILITPLQFDDKHLCVKVVNPKYPVVIKNGRKPPLGLKLVAKRRSTIKIICFNMGISYDELKNMCPHNDIYVQRYILLNK